MMEMLTFREALFKAGLPTKENIVCDGKLHRLHVCGDRPGTKNGWYILFSDGDFTIAVFGCWKRQIYKTWHTKSPRDMTPAECVEHKKRMDAARTLWATEKQAIRKTARERAARIWNLLLPSPHDHPYLTMKGVKSHGLRISKNSLVIPLHDSAAALHSLQFIDAEGNKRFLSGGRKHGCYFIIGKPNGTICIVEGYATGASIYETTGHPVAVAFDSGNLLPVAQSIKKRFPEAKIILCADNDAHTQGNPGVSKAREAAEAISGFLAVPPIVGDFNDFIRSVSCA